MWGQREPHHPRGLDHNELHGIAPIVIRAVSDAGPRLRSRPRCSRGCRYGPNAETARFKPGAPRRRAGSHRRTSEGDGGPARAQTRTLLPPERPPSELKASADCPSAAKALAVGQSRSPGFDPVISTNLVVEMQVHPGCSMARPLSRRQGGMRQHRANPRMVRCTQTR